MLYKVNVLKKNKEETNQIIWFLSIPEEEKKKNLKEFY